MKLGHSPRGFGASLMRLAALDGSALAPSGTESAAVGMKDEAVGNGETGDAPQPGGISECEREAEVLETIRCEAEALSVDCRATEDRPLGRVALQLTALEECPVDESEYELLDVNPASIDEYMNRLLARADRTRPRKSEAVAPRHLFTPACSESAPETPPCLPETNRPVPDGAALASPVAEAATARRPRDTGDSREKLREIVNRSTRSTLVQQIRRRHLWMVVRRFLPVFLSLAWAGILYAAHYLYGARLRHLAWGSTAISLVALLGMVHLWSQAARKQSRLHARVSGAHWKSTRTTPESDAPPPSLVTPRR